MSPNEPEGSAFSRTSEIETAVNQIRERINEIADRFTAGVDNVSRKWFDLDVSARLKIVGLLQDIRTAINKILDIVSAVLVHHAPVTSMINISYHWLHAVKMPVSNMAAGTAKWATADLFNGWEGASADHYKEQVLVFQAGAAEALAEQAGFMSAWLYEIVLANVDYVTNLASVLATIAENLTTAAIEAASVVDLPFALADVAATIGALVGASVNNLIGIANRIVVAGERARQVVDAIVSHTKFPNGRWPESVAPPKATATLTG